MARSYEDTNHGVPGQSDEQTWRHWGDGRAGRMVGARIQGYSSALVDYVDVAVDTSGNLLATLSASSVEIGTVDQGTGGSSAWKVDGSAVTQPVSIASMPSTPVTGPLTDTQLRASAVPVSLSTLPALAAGSAVIGHVIVDTAPSTAVTNVGTFAVQASWASAQHVILDSGTIAALTDGTLRGAVTVTNATASNLKTAATLDAETTKVIGTVNLAAGQTLGTLSTITNVVHVDDNSGTLTVDAPAATPVFVRLSDGAAALATLPVSLASVPSHAVTNAGTFAVQASEADGVNVTLGALADAAVGDASGSLNAHARQIAKLLGAALTVNAHAVTNAGTFAVQQTKPATATRTSPASVTTTVATVLASNAARYGATVYNESGATCYLALGATATLTDYTLQVAIGGYYETPASYTGVLTGITSSGTAVLRVTEVTT